MPNGSGLLGSAATGQTVFAVPKINDPEKYYLFTVGSAGLVNPIVGLYYSVIDMQLDGGLGDIVPGLKNIPVPNGDSAVTQMTAIRHHNNRDVWLVVVRYGQIRQYLAYLIDSTGLNTTPVVSNCNLTVTIRGAPKYDLRISPDGKNLVCSDTLMDVCYFNPSTGEVTHRFKIKPIGFESTMGKEFSIDSRCLYFIGGGSSLLNSKVGQFDMMVADSLSFLQSSVLIGSGGAYHMQMGPDWKIYIDTHTGGLIDSLCRINNPSAQGLACNYEQDAICLQGNPNNGSLPQFLQRYKVYIHSNGNCSNFSIHFSGDIWPPADSIYWNFGDTASGVLNYSNLESPSHIYADTGNFLITLFVRHIDNRTDTVCLTFQIIASPEPELGPDKTICDGDSIILNAGFFIGCSYQWSNLTLGQYNIGMGQTYIVNQVGNYMVTAIGSNGCIGRDTIQIFTTPIPVITNTPLTKSICSGDSTNVILSANIPGTTFNWTASLTSGIVTGFSADSGLAINQVLINTTDSNGVVIYHITPKVSDCIGTPADYTVTVTPGDSVNVSVSASANNVCAGTSVTFTATPTNGGANPSYQWKVNGINVGGNSPVYTYTPANGDIVTCSLTSSNLTCTSNNPALSNQVIMVINTNLPVIVVISASQNPVCSNVPVTFTATPTNGGGAPQYQWKVNGINVGGNSPIFIYVPVNGDVVICEMMSSENCTLNNPATSNPVIMVNNSNLVVGVSIAASANPVCAGTSVTFTATPTNGGPLPTYQWKVTGIIVGGNSPFYTYIPASGDIVTCTLTSSLSCTSNNPSSSNPLSILINPPPSVSFSKCTDTITTTNAKPFKLKGGIPLSGTYSGPGVNPASGIWDPAAAGVGNKTITYSYTNTALCSASALRVFKVVAAPAFACGNLLTDVRDNETYQTVQIGAQCWFAESLKYGTEIPDNLVQRDNCIPEKYTCPSSLVPPPSYYQWDELMQYDDTPGLQGLCPPGWHVPTKAEWQTLFNTLNGPGFAASAMLLSGFSGFNARVNGSWFENAQWDYDSFATHFWTSTSRGSLKAWAHAMNNIPDDHSVATYPSSRANAFSVRCVKD